MRSLPAVVINGKLTGCCAGRAPDEHVIGQALQSPGRAARGSSLPRC
jgi:hypothetical protein